jgi:exopolyphosphatase/guanosine-5'-triphosphate,3'-diphosphate pyrophosphatase
MNKLYLLALFVCFSSCSHFTSKNCIIRKGAFDIGSGSTKAIFAVINKCEGKIVEVLYEKQSPLKFKASMRYNDKLIPSTLQIKANKVLKKWKAQGEKLGVTEYSAVATEVFRQATNGSRFIKKLSQETLIPIKIITQEDEAIIGFWAGVASSEQSSEKVLVWDIGGGSMQMSHLNDEGQMKFYLGKIASVSFKQRISGNMSPNPLLPVGAKQAVIKARNLAKIDIPQDFIKSIQSKEVIGIGGVHYHSLGKKLNYAPYSSELLNQKLLTTSYLTDKQIGGSYSATDVTNMALVLGFMKALNVNRVIPIKANLAHGLLLAPIN